MRQTKFQTKSNGKNIRCLIDMIFGKYSINSAYGPAVTLL